MTENSNCWANRFLCLWLCVPVILGGCATITQDETVAVASSALKSLGHGPVVLSQAPDQSEALKQKANDLLKSELSEDRAVKLALANSPQFQVLLAQAWAEASTAVQSGRIANPMFLFERTRLGGELELARLFSFGLLDLLTLPSRSNFANAKLAQSQSQLVANLIDQVTIVRQAWVRAVGAQQSFIYAQQVLESAEASAELAKRMQAAGNFNKIARARQQVFYADAATQLAKSQALVWSTREQLVRLLGLTDAQANDLRLVERLPDLPRAPRQPDEVSTVATQQRIDIQLSQAMLRTANAQKGGKLFESFTDIEIGLRRDTVTNAVIATATQEREKRRGFEVGIRLPIFDSGDLKRSAMTAQTLVATNQLQATIRAANSHLRESYSNYRTAWDIAQHYREEIVPLRKLILDENVLRYNGMIIGVFDLLADSREQIRSVIAAIDAQQQFWLSDVGIRAAMLGKPTMMTQSNMTEPGSNDGPAH